MSGTNGAGGASPEFVKYHFRHAIGGFFEFPTANARKILPPHLHPVEPHHGQSVLSVMAFDFHESMVGEYGELILSVLVMPRVAPGSPLRSNVSVSAPRGKIASWPPTERPRVLGSI